MKGARGRSGSLLLVCALVVLAVACSNDESNGGGATTSLPPGTSGRATTPGLILTGQGDIVEADVDGRPRATLLHYDDFSIIDASLSPDGGRLAFVRVPKFKPGITDFGSDVYVSGRNGEDPQPIATHSIPNELLRSPVWLADSRTVVFQVQGLTAVNGVPQSRLDRIDTQSGKRDTLVQPARLPAVSQDGKVLLYHTDGDIIGQETIWLTDGFGATPRPVISTSATVGSFGNAAPSPDGSKIALGAAMLTSVVPTVPRGVFASFASRNGLPEDTWLLNADGSGLKRMLELGEDLPSLAWSPDGRYILSMGAKGLYRIDTTNGQTQRLGDGLSHGGVVWFEP